jgi:hypothetical protein
MGGALLGEDSQLGHMTWLELGGPGLGFNPLLVTHSSYSIKGRLGASLHYTFACFA